VPEVPYDLDKDIIPRLASIQRNGKKHFIIIVAEGVGKTEEIAREINEKTGIETRTTILGHVQRGGSPTVRDRVVASVMGYYAVELLSNGIGNRVVVMKDNKIIDYDIYEALAMKKPFENHLYDISNTISI
jgi:6-phosphofructokinase 1